jgi:hypothetical protein
MDQVQTRGHSDPPAEGPTFFTLVGTAQEERHARLLVESLRAHGGNLSHCPFWVFRRDVGSADPARPSHSYDGLEGVQVYPLDREGAFSYYFAAKVRACAQAERLAGPHVRSLVWLNPQSLIVNPPVLFDLAPSFDTAFRTVHHRNVGSPAGEPLDAFWQGVYLAAGLDDVPFTLESYADKIEIRPYVNTHCFSIDPAVGLCQAWLERFQAMVADRAFQAGPCRDELHQVFLHQAVLSALLTKTLDRERIRLLPPEYSYPLHMHDQVPVDRRAQALNDLVCPVYEEEIPLDGISVREPLRSWLDERLGQ